jgi:hypothetical protein
MKRLISRATFAGILCGATAAPALAVPTFFVLQKDTRFIQTGPATTAGDGFTFLGRATPNDGIGPIDFNGGTFSFPASSPLSTATLSPVGAELQYTSGKVDQATLQTDYPGGMYTFHLTDSGNASHTQNETVDSTLTPTPVTVPALSAASFSALQGMNPAQPLTVTFNAFADPGPNALIFLAVTDAGTGATLLFDGLQPNITQDTIPAHTLAAGGQYNFTLFFDNTVITADNNGEVIGDTRTRGSFMTQAVPEPAGAVMLVALGICGLRGRRRER